MYRLYHAPRSAALGAQALLAVIGATRLEEIRRIIDDSPVYSIEPQGRTTR